MRRLLSLVAACALVVAIVGPAAAASGASDAHAVHYYLSLGDSLAAGYQPTGDPALMHRTDEGYADQLYQMARGTFPKLRHEKLGCPGETTETFIYGGICPYENGSQLAEALAFLHAHRKYVSFVTIDLGANDFTCQTSIDCIPPGAAKIAANLPGILAALRAAAGPSIPIVGATLYDPFLVYWLSGTQDGRDLAMLSVSEAIVPINDLEEGIYAAFGMPVADVEGAFSTTDFATMVAVPFYPVPVPLNVARICSWTWVCDPTYGGDFHANADGYRIMALQYRAELGF
jgi:lysophospholipase L1-like esterase